MEMAICLQFENDLPKVFWAEVVNISVYLLNLLPTRTLVGKLLMKCDEVYTRCNVATLKPTSYEEAAKHDEWRATMIDEIKMIEKNSTWQLVDQPKNCKVVGVKWDYRTKLNPDGSVNKHKARFVVKGYFQQQGIDFSNTFAPHNWFIMSESEATWYIKKLDDEKQLIVSLYVDDLLVTGYNEVKYALEVLKKFKMENCKPIATPLVLNEKLSKSNNSEKADAFDYKSLIGNLLYFSATRLDIMYDASLLSRFMQAPSRTHYGATKKVMRYVKGTFNYGIWYLKNDSCKLEGYTDNDWVGNVDDCKSASGYVFSFGSGTFAWNSKKQDMVAQSSAEAKYVSTEVVANQAIWLRKILANLEQNTNKATVILVDNKSAIAITKNPVRHGRTKHMNVTFHAIREAERLGEISVRYCKSEDQVADVLTKAISRPRFEFLRTKLGVSQKNLNEEY
ncbi:Retrovirus-related Pol polyprotein from transposon TNT 1-94 [Gossypium australe]|uniref:Retrovirus-related Pol polyprotein from transposon TNT 1-94 n=1 Tax=Gossypium australe TaxID=47621 RepID=A0A5B6VIV7_9ROSI|nr:Retrovirus-related Pol polyprotein from transposon TNT 1-94 [Gossypium australe]